MAVARNSMSKDADRRKFTSLAIIGVFGVLFLLIHPVMKFAEDMNAAKLARAFADHMVLAGKNVQDAEFDVKGSCGEIVSDEMNNENSPGCKRAKIKLAKAEAYKEKLDRNDGKDFDTVALSKGLSDDLFHTVASWPRPVLYVIVGAMMIVMLVFVNFILPMIQKKRGVAA